MEKATDTSLREKLVAVLFALVGLSVLVFSWRNMPITNLHPDRYLLAVLFAGAIILADHFPIHLAHGTKASLTSLPIYLLAVLLPAPLAILGVGGGLLTANLLARRRTRIITQRYRLHGRAMDDHSLFR